MPVGAVAAAAGVKLAAGNPVAGVLILGALAFGVWLGFHRIARSGGQWQRSYSGYWAT